MSGEAGVGKTRLVQELTGSAGGRPVLTGHCHPLGQPFPFGPLVEAIAGPGRHLLPHAGLTPLVGALGAILPELTPQLPAPPPPAGDAPTERHRLLRAIRELLAAIGPAVLALEDAQWMDESTYELLDLLAVDPPGSLSLVLTYRPEDLPRRHLPADLAARFGPRSSLTELELRPLDRAAVGELAAQLLGVDRVSEGFGAVLHERTGGLPFAVKEMVRSLDCCADLAQAGRRVVRRTLEPVGVPHLLRQRLLARMRRLDPDATSIVEAAAVVTQPATEALLGSVAGFGDQRTVRALSAALKAGLLVVGPDGWFTFRHALTRQAVYEEIVLPERRLLHDRAARALAIAEPTPYEQLTFHERAAGRERTWWRRAEAAAMLAARRGDEQSAARLLCEALTAEHLPSAARIRMARTLARVAQNGLPDQATPAILRRVLREEKLPAGVRGELRLNLGLLLVNQGAQVAAGRAEIARSVPELRRSPALAARALSSLAVPLWTGEHLDVHRRWLALAAAASARANDPGTNVAVLVNELTVRMHTGDGSVWSMLATLPAEGATVTEGQHLARAARNAADAATWLGRYQLAEQQLARAERLANRSAADLTGSFVAASRLRLDWYRGRWDGLLERARAVAADLDDVPGAAASAHLVIGLLLGAQGQQAAACRRLAQVTADPNLALPVQLAAAAGLAGLHVTAGRAELAAAVADRAVDLLRRKGNWVWAADLAPAAVGAYLSAGRDDDARWLIAELVAGLEGTDAPAADAALAACRGQLCSADSVARHAVAWYSAATRRYRAIGQPYAASRLLAAAGQCRFAADPESGARMMSAALACFEALDATCEASRWRCVLRGHGVRLGSRRGRRGYGDQLSPREREVVSLVASGLTNRQVADALFLSVRTVEDHVAHAMRKLGARTRHELVIPGSRRTGPRPERSGS